MAVMGMAGQPWYLQMPHEKIVEFIAVIEACEGLAVPRVLDKERGLVELLTAPDLEPELEQVLAGIAESFPLERVSRPPGTRSLADDEG
jgi:hypothetical protein